MQNVLTLARCIVCGELADLATRNLRQPVDSGYLVHLCSAHQAKAEEAFARDRRFNGWRGALFAETKRAELARAVDMATGLPVAPAPATGHVCTTPAGCACSSSGEECCCNWLPDEKQCRNCGAIIIAIDIETGEPIAPATPAKVVDLVDVLERRGRVDVAAVVRELRAGGAEVCTADELEPKSEAEVLDDAALERMTLAELAGVRSRLADPIDRIRFDNRWIRGTPLGLQLLALDATGAE